MYIIDGKGYQPSTPEDLKDQFIKDLQSGNQDFFTYSQTLQGALLNEATTFLMYPETLTAQLLNSFSYAQANPIMLDLLGADRGIRRKGAYKAEVTLRFTGKAGMVIPQDLEVKGTADDSPVFMVFKETLIESTTGVVDVLAYTDATSFGNINIGDLTKIVDNIPNLTVTNIDTPTAPVEAESYESYRSRVLQRMRNPKVGSIGSLLSEILNIEGVDTRLVGWRKGELSSGGKTYKTYELIVGGGDPVKIAYAIYEYGGINSYLYLSDPSGGEAQRTVSQDITVFNNTDTYKFTRPKKLVLDISVEVALKNVETSNNSLQALTQESMTNYINNIPVGEVINIASLTEAFMEGFRRAGGTALNINAKQLNFTILANSAPLSEDSFGFFAIQFDEYCEIGKYTVSIN